MTCSIWRSSTLAITLSIRRRINRAYEVCTLAAQFSLPSEVSMPEARSQTMRIGQRSSHSAYSPKFLKIAFNDENSDIIRKTNMPTELCCPAEDRGHKIFGRKGKAIL